jgi:hypothetical protein
MQRGILIVQQRFLVFDHILLLSIHQKSKYKLGVSKLQNEYETFLL